MLRLNRYSHARDLLDAAEPWLAQREAEHNLILGIAGNLADAPDDGPGEAPYLAVVNGPSGPVAVAVRTPPFNLVLSEVDDTEALALLAADLADTDLAGVTGPPAASADFGRRWQAEHAGRLETVMRERIYRASRIIPPRPVDGRARRATGADRGLLAAWVVAFHDEALPGEGGERARRVIDEWDPETGRQFWIWEDAGAPVSLVGAGSRTPRGIRIGPVYTPPPARGRGYASNLTAVACQRAFDEGRSFCFLYTDLANATANHIYAAIGFEPVADAVMLRFVAD